MPQQTFILRRKTDDSSKDCELLEFLKSVKVSVLDTGLKSILVNSPFDLIEKMPISLMEEWMVIPEKKIQVPDTRKKILRDPAKVKPKPKLKSKPKKKTP